MSADGEILSAKRFATTLLPRPINISTIRIKKTMTVPSKELEWRESQQDHKIKFKNVVKMPTSQIQTEVVVFCFVFIIIYSLEFFTSVLADGLSLEFE